MSDLKRAFRVHHGDRVDFNLCPSRKHTCEGKIDDYYSDLQAWDNGWRYTTDIKFCPPTEVAVWVCPECASKYEWREKDGSIVRKRGDRSADSQRRESVGENEKPVG